MYSLNEDYARIVMNTSLCPFLKSIKTFIITLTLKYGRLEQMMGPRIE